MQLSLEDFEQNIDGTILRRGRSYFNKGYVRHLEEIAAGDYEALVTGTDDYTVNLTLENDLITRYSCDCPYDLGPVCKHIVAVIYCLQSRTLKPKAGNSPKKKNTNQSIRRKSQTQTEDDLIDKLSQAELKEFLHRQIQEQPDLRNKVISAFGNQNATESRAFYKRQIKAILKSAGDRHGFIDWRAVQHVGRAVFDFMQNAGTHLENGNYSSAFFIASAVLEEMTAALQFADDSNADIGDNIDLALDLLFELPKKELPQNMRQQLFDYAIQSYRKKIFEGWDWHLGMLELATHVYQNENEARTIIALLDQVDAPQYQQEAAQVIKLKILRETQGKTAVKKFLEQHLSNPNFRSEAIRNAISDKDFKKAIQLAQAGIKQDAQNKPGLADDWYDWLLKIALKQKDTAKVIEYARLLLVVPNRDWNHYYNILNENISPDEWEGFVEKLVSDLLKQASWPEYNLVTEILIRETLWDQLWEMVSQGYNNQIFGLESLKSYEKYIKKDHTDELAGFYEEGIFQFLERNTGRPHYKKACRYIRWIVKLGAWERAQRFVEKLRAAYSNRPALLEELNRL